MSYDKPIDSRVASLLGKEEVFHAAEEIGKATVRKFAAAIGDYNPLYWDEQFAEKSGYGGIIAPPTLIFEVNCDVGDEIDDIDRWQKWFGFSNMQRASNEYEIFQPARPDDVITRRRKIVGVTEKQRKTGKLIFLTTETTYTNQRGELLGFNRDTVALSLPES